VFGLRLKLDESGVTPSLRFFGITSPLKITSEFTSLPLDSQPNTIENVSVSFHPSLYIQPNARPVFPSSNVVDAGSPQQGGRWVPAQGFMAP
jgi:hypothetical protein